MRPTSLTVWAGLEPELLEQMAQLGSYKVFPEGGVLLDYGQAVEALPIVEQGQLAVYSVDPVEARELFLYSIHPGQTCSLALGCCVYGQASQIRVVAESETHLLLIPPAYVAEWLERYPGFRSFAYRMMSTRFVNLVETIEAIAFRNLPERLEQFLLKRAREQDSRLVNLSHEQVASQLGSSRVVVSRLLKVMEKEGNVLLFRGQIKWMGPMEN